MRPNACGITPASHVTQNAKDMANAGRTLGAGLVAGACPSRAGVIRKILESGSGASVEVNARRDGSCCDVLSERAGRHSQFVGVLRVVPGTQSHDERAD